MKKKNSEAFEVAKALLESLPVQKPGTHFDCLIPPAKRDGPDVALWPFLGFMFGLLIGPFISDQLFPGLEVLFAIVCGILYPFIFSTLFYAYNENWKAKHKIAVKIYNLYAVLEGEEQQGLEGIFYKRILVQAQKERVEDIKGEEYV